MGDGSKISASEIVTKNAAGQVMGLDLLGVEYGSNANGEWVRWNFGWQVCWHLRPLGKGISVDGTVSGVTGLLGKSTPVMHFPAEFYSVDAVIPLSRGDGGSYYGWSSLMRNDTTSCELYLFRPGTARNFRYGYVAVGWWKQPGT